MIKFLFFFERRRELLAPSTYLTLALLAPARHMKSGKCHADDVVRLLRSSMDECDALTVCAVWKTSVCG